jgi:autotransporter-associated beta strand protein
MNASIGTNKRRLVSDLDAHILSDAYGYATNLPSAIQTFLASYNSSTHALTVSAEPGVNGNLFTVDVSGSNVVVNVNGTTGTFTTSGLVSIVVNTGTGFDFVTLARTPNVSILVNSAGLTAVHLGTGGSAQGVNGSITLNNPASFTSLFVEDSNDQMMHSVFMEDAGSTDDGQLFGLFPAAVHYRNSQSGGVTLETGTGSNTINLFSTGNALVSLVGNSSNTTVNVGNGTTQNIRNGVRITNPHAFTTLNVDDSNDGGDRTVALHTDNGPFSSGDFGEIDGLSANNASVFYKYADTTSVTVRGGRGNNTYSVTDVVRPVTLNTGTGTDTVSLPNSVGSLTVNAQGAPGADTVNLGSNAATTFGGSIKGAAVVHKVGAGTATLSGTNNYTGTTFLDAGTLRLGSTFAQNGNPIVVNAGATLDVEALEPFIGDLSGSGNVVLGNILLLEGRDTQTFGGPISGLGGLVLEGGGTLTLTGNNTYSGQTEISAGTLRLGSPSAGSPNSTVVVGPGATLDVASLATIGSLSGSGNVLLNGFLIAGTNNASGVFSGRISGTNGLEKAGTGTLTLSGTNTYGGPTEMNNGTLRVGSATALPGLTWASVDPAGTLDVNGFAVAVGALSGSAGGRVLLGNGSLTVGAANLGDGFDVFGGAISGNGGLTKVGTGTLTLSGTDTYFGTTHVTGGTLLVTGFLVGDVNLDAGTTLAGTGFTGNVSGAGTVSPGTANATGVLGPEDLSLQRGTLRVRLNGPNPGSGYDQVFAFGGVTLGGTATLNVTAGFVSPIGTVFTIVASTFNVVFTEGDFVDGTFASLPDGALLTASGQTFRINYTYDADGDAVVTLTHVAASSATTTALAADVSPSVFGQAVTLTATVSGAAGTPTGSVTFFDGATALGTAPLDGNGQATLTTAALAVGDHTLTVSYNGDGGGLFAGSTSDVLTQTVAPAAVTLALAADANPADPGQTVNLSVTVAAAAPGAGTPTGFVTFLDGDTVLGTAQLDGNGQAALAVTLFDSGTHLITVSYASDGNFADGLSDPLALTIN